MWTSSCSSAASTSDNFKRPQFDCREDRSDVVVCVVGFQMGVKDSETGSKLALRALEGAPASRPPQERGPLVASGRVVLHVRHIV